MPPARQVSASRFLPRAVLLVSAAVVLLLACAAAWLWRRMPPRTARLLPETDAIVYLDLVPLRRLVDLKPLETAPSPEYKVFLDRTGIVPERDLDRAAFALDRMADPHGPNGPVAFSEVVEGRFDPVRLAVYLHTLAKTEERYAGHTVYAIPSESRTLRVALLDHGLIAGSNAPTPEQMHAILDRDRALLPAASTLLAGYYKDVPTLAPAWALGRLGMPFADAAAPLEPSHGQPSSSPIQVLGMDLPLPADSLFVASLRLGPGAAHGAFEARLRIDQVAASEQQAHETVQSLTALLNLTRTLELTRNPVPRTTSEAAVRQIVDSIIVEQKGNRAMLTADATAETLAHLKP